jgi:hypothetical protein
LPIAVVKPLVAWAGVSVEAFCSAEMNESRAALPPGEVSVASWVVSLARYVFNVAAAWVVDSDCSGVSVEMTPELILLIVTQSAADGLVPELAAVELAGAETDADVAAAVGVELEGELDEEQPAMRAPLAARTARTVSDEPRDISGTSMGAEHKPSRLVPAQVAPSLPEKPASLAPDAAPPGPLRGRRKPDGADAHGSGHAHAEERLPIAVVRVVVACAWVSVRDFPSAATNEPRAALPAGEVSVASSVVSLARYAFNPAVALAVGSVCSGVSVETTPELILLIVTQSAADGLLAELAAAEADVAGAETDADADVAAAVGVELDDELDELQPTMRAPLAASPARTVSDERLDISGTSMGVELSVASHENLVLP